MYALQTQCTLVVALQFFCNRQSRTCRAVNKVFKRSSASNPVDTISLLSTSVLLYTSHLQFVGRLYLQRRPSSAYIYISFTEIALLSKPPQRYPKTNHPTLSKMSDQRLKFAIFGVGRMGARHARNIAFHTPRAELVAIVDPNPAALESAREWAPKTVQFYSTPEECLEKSGCEAVLVASATAEHAPNTIAAIKAGKVSHPSALLIRSSVVVRDKADGQHVLCEKPISIDLETSRSVVNFAESHPELKVMVGFSRRCTL